jgi:hypothetical protein
MRWSAIRAAHPDRWLVVEALEAHSENDHRIFDRIAVVEVCSAQHDGPRKRGEGVWAVVASRQRASDRATAERSGPLLSLGTGWEARVSEFLDAVEKLRA